MDFSLVISGTIGGGVVALIGSLFFRALKDKLAEQWGLEKLRTTVNANSLQLTSLNQLVSTASEEAGEALDMARLVTERQDHQWARVTETVIQPLQTLTGRLERVAEIQEKHGRELAVLIDRDRRERT